MTTIARTINDLGPHVSIRYPFRSKFVNVNGWRMHYIDEGPPNAPPVLLLHGNPTWGYLWRDTIPPLLAAGYRVIEPDQIGFGLSEHPHSAGAHSLDNHAANLVALLDQLDLNGVFFVCHDWGGPTGLMRANVEIRLEIQAYVRDGVPDNVVRIVTENGQVLKLENHGFEEEDDDWISGARRN